MTLREMEAFLQRIAQAHAEEGTALALEALKDGPAPALRPEPRHDVWVMPCPVCGRSLSIPVELAQSRFGDVYRVPWCEGGHPVWEAPPEAEAAFFAALEQRGKEAER